MSRRNNVRGPTSALTEFLRESGITPTTIARRRATQVHVQQQPAAGPSNIQEDNEQENGPANAEIDAAEEYASDNLDEPEEERPAPKKRKLTKAAESKLKAKEKAKAKRKAGKADDDYEDEDEDPYNALSKMWKADLPKPPVGSFEECARCSKQFTVTKYTLPANPPPGYLCHLCAKASGADPFKKPAAPKKRKPAGERRNIVSFEERRFPTLASMCIDVISKYIDDVEALGDIGSINMDELAKSLARNRSLTPHNAQLFYNVQNTELTMYDATNLDPPAFCTLAVFSPNLTHLRLDYCGRMSDEVINAWSTSLPNLRRLELLGPFLVRAPAWQTFFRSHPTLEGFLIVQSPRFDIECMRVLSESCSGLTELRLKEIGQMSDAFLEHMKILGGHLTYLEISKPGDPNALSEQALVDLMTAIGPSLTHLDLSGNTNITDGFLFQGLKPYMQRLTSLGLADTPELTDAGVAEFFSTWADAAQQAGYDPVPRLSSINMAHNHLLSSDTLVALLKHSGASLTDININGWKATSQEALKSIADNAPELRKLDMGWCREADDWVMQALMEKCSRIEEVKAWGCQRLTERCPRKRNVNIYGVEAQ